MKILLCIGFLCFGLAAFSQSSSNKKPGADSLSKTAQQELQKLAAKDSSFRAKQIEMARKKKTDSLSTVLQEQLQIPKAKADDVLKIINGSIDKMNINARNRELRGEEKINRLKEIAKERDQKIEALLSQNQIQQLHTIMLMSR